MTRPGEARLSKRALFGDIGYEPHAGQIAVHRSRALRRVLACGVRWGKTKCATMEVVAAGLVLQRVQARAAARPGVSRRARGPGDLR
jgi:hypothetical protein